MTKAETQQFSLGHWVDISQINKLPKYIIEYELTIEEIAECRQHGRDRGIARALQYNTSEEKATLDATNGNFGELGFWNICKLNGEEYSRPILKLGLEHQKHVPDVGPYQCKTLGYLDSVIYEGPNSKRPDSLFKIKDITQLNPLHLIEVIDNGNNVITRLLTNWGGIPAKEVKRLLMLPRSVPKNEQRKAEGKRALYLSSIPKEYLVDI
jgi:hypothetical protein